MHETSSLLWSDKRSVVAVPSQNHLRSMGENVAGVGLGVE